jgi:5'-nucleotidase (lipoprotein e(P4) family)
LLGGGDAASITVLTGGPSAAACDASPLQFSKFPRRRLMIGKKEDHKERFRYHNNIDALLWLDTSAEQAALYLQAFALARHRVEEALRRHALQHEPGNPLCVISDLDETLLDNSAHNGWLVATGRNFEEKTNWNDYCRSMQSRATAGSISFARWLGEQMDSWGRPVELIYVTSRLGPRDPTQGVREETLTNLRNLGFPTDDMQNFGTRLFMKGHSEPPAGDLADKYLQYAYIRRSFTLILQLGDNLADFAPEYRSNFSHTRRRLRAEGEDQTRWGAEWIVMPNPVYGDWQRSLTAGNKDDEHTDSAVDPVREPVTAQHAPKMQDAEVWNDPRTPEDESRN